MIQVPAVVKKRTSDHEGESQVTLIVPASHYDAASQIGKMTGRIVYVGVMEEQEAKERGMAV